MRYDLILDVKTNRSVFDYAGALNPGGCIYYDRWTTGRLFQALVLRPIISLISKKHIRIVMLKPNKDLVYMNKLFEAGKVRAVIDKAFESLSCISANPLTFHGSRFLV